MLTCSICNLPSDVREAVDRALAAGVKLRVIASQCGKSKSALGRHKLTCLPRQVMQSHKAKANATRDGRIIVDWGADTARRFTLGPKVISASQLRQDDVLLVVRYEETQFYKNPRALVPSPELLDKLHALAIEEDRERTKQLAN